MSPYRKTGELPDSVKDNVPAHVQEIYMEAYNSVWDLYKDPENRRRDSSREETAHRVAWTAVKQKYKKNEKMGRWKRKDD